MASPNTGLFASSFVDGFLKTKRDREKRDQFEKINKLQAKLIEMQLNAGQLKLDAEQDFLDALAGSPPIDTPGDVGPDEFGPPKSLSGREPLGLAGLITKLRDDPKFLSAAIQSGQLGLKDFLGGQQETAFTREARLAGKPPGSPEFAEAFEAKNRQDPSSLLALDLLTELRNEDVVKRQTERLAGIEEKRISRAEGRIAIRNAFSLATEAVQLQRDLRKTALQSGIPGGDELQTISAIVGAVQEFFGKDSPQATIIVQKRQRLKKLFAELLRESIDNLKSARGITDQGRSAILAALPTLENSAVANTQLLGDMMQGVLDGADIAGYKDIENREAIEAFIADPLAGLSKQNEGGPTFLDTATGKARSAFDSASGKARSGFDAATVFAQDAADKARSSIVTASEIARMTIQELQQIDPSKITAEAREAARKRYNELYDAATK